jgi:YD repeat-containing protein
LIDADGNRVLYGYDLDSHTQEITDRNGNTTVYEYDGRGNVTSKTDPLGHTTACGKARGQNAEKQGVRAPHSTM